jgi:hypothetical protein
VHWICRIQWVSAYNVVRVYAEQKVYRSALCVLAAPHSKSEGGAVKGAGIKVMINREK